MDQRPTPTTSVILAVEVGLLLALLLYQAITLTYLHRETWRQMDFFDAARRLGPATFYLSVALACVLLILNVGPEWRLPPILLAAAMTAVGLTRDVRREQNKRKGR